MQGTNRIHFETAIAKAMLEEIQGNQKIKQILSEIAAHLRSTVLSPIIEIMKNNEQFDDLSPFLKEVIYSWALKHSKEDAFLGALLPDYSLDELMKTASGRAMLLTAIDKNLSPENIKQISTLQEVIAFIKTLDDMGYCYFYDAETKSNL